MEEQNIYDNETFFNKYQNLRMKVSANDLVEIPELFELIGDVEGLSVLNLGCGTGGHDQRLVQMGAKRVLGVDISQNMINEAIKNNESDKIEFKVLSMAEIEKIDEKFDLVISSLAIHYVEDYDSLCKKVYNLLNDNGRFIFSCGHPMDSCIIFNGFKDTFVTINDKKYYLISDYNNEGKRVGHFLVDDVETYHRNMSHLVNGLLDAGFTLEKMHEAQASEEALQERPDLIELKDHSYYVYFKCKK